VGCCKAPKYTFSASLLGLGAGWLAEKWLEPQTTSEIRGFCPLGTPTKKIVNFLDQHCKGKVFTNNLNVESLFPTCLV